MQTSKIHFFFLLLALVVPAFLTIPGSYYPYTVPKAVFFFIMVDLLLLLTVFQKGFSLKNFIAVFRNPVGIALLAFFAISLVSGIFGLHPTRSFFGTPVRMTGIIASAHFLLFYGLLRLHLKTPEDWKKIARWSVAASIAICILALTQAFFIKGFLDFRQSRQIIATLGNQAFLAEYLLFHFFIAVWLLRQKLSWFWQWLTRASLVLIPLVIFLSAVRGVLLAFIVGVVVLGIFSLKCHWQQVMTILKKTFPIALVVMAIIGAVFFSIRTFFPENEIVRWSFVHLSDFSWQSSTIQTRVILFLISIKGFLASPLLGTGPENFEIAYNQHYLPEVLRYGIGENWFDRAHNILLQTGVETGIFGLVALLILWGLILQKAWKHDIIWFSLFLAVFVSSLIEVDNFVGLVLFYFCLTNLQFLSKPETESHEVQPVKIWNKPVMAFTTILASVSIAYHLFFLRGLFLMNNAAFRYLHDSWNLTQFQESFEQAYQKSWISPYIQALGTKDAITAFLVQGFQQEGNLLNVPVDLLKSLSEKMELGIQRFPHELRFVYFLGRLYKDWARADPAYFKPALKYLKQGIAYNSKRQLFYFSLGELIMEKGKTVLEIGKGIEQLQKASSLDPEAAFPHWALGKAYFAAKMEDGALREFDKAIALGITKFFSYVDLPEMLRISQFLGSQKHYKEVNAILKMAIFLQPENAALHAKLATSYIMINDKQNAKKHAEKAIQMDPSLKKGSEPVLKALGQ